MRTLGVGAGACAELDVAVALVVDCPEAAGVWANAGAQAKPRTAMAIKLFVSSLLIALVKFLAGKALTRNLALKPTTELNLAPSPSANRN